MAYVISDSCVSCGTCAGECPVGAISAGASQYEIDANSCIMFSQVMNQSRNLARCTRKQDQLFCP